LAPVQPRDFARRLPSPFWGLVSSYLWHQQTSTLVKGAPCMRGKRWYNIGQGGKGHALGARGARIPLGRGRGCGRRAAHGAVWRARQAAVGVFAAANLWPRVLEPHPGIPRRAVASPAAHGPALFL